MNHHETSFGVTYQVRLPLSNGALNELFRVSWPAHAETDFQPILAHSLLYVSAYHTGRLIGFVNVAWDGGVHAFLLDTTVHPSYRRQGNGVQLVRHAVAAVQVRGIHWLHVDFEPHLATFYERCGFQHTEAGLIALNS